VAGTCGQAKSGISPAPISMQSEASIPVESEAKHGGIRKQEEMIVKQVIKAKSWF